LSSLSALLLALTSCGGDVGSDGVAPPAPVGPFVRLSPVDRLIRASIALRGIRPTITDMQAVRSDPSAFDDLVAQYVETPEFGDTIEDMWSEILLDRNDSYLQPPARGALEGYDLNELYTSTTEEPLKLIRDIVETDQPFTSIVTADYMLTDDVVAKMYGVPYDFSSAEKWQKSWWGDARPAAGILSSAQVWRRWESNGSNFHRGRANMVARELLCEPFDKRDILVPGGINVADEEAVANAVRTNTACVGCHASLDPLAGYFWGYKQLIHRNFIVQSIDAGCQFDWQNGAVPEFGNSYLFEYYCYPLQQYSTSDEFLWQTWSLPEPSYYGVPAKDLTEVGQLIADDPRFSECQARQFYGYYDQLEPDQVPIDTALDLQASFEKSNYNARQLAIDAVSRDDFDILRSIDPAVPEPPGAGLLTVRPEQYGRIIKNLTGYQWLAVADEAGCGNPNGPIVQEYGNQCWNTVDLNDSDLFGFRAMEGGVDGVTVTRAIHTMTPTKLLAMGQLATDAAGFVVDNDLKLDDPAKRHLLTQIADASQVDEVSVRNELVWLYQRILGQFLFPSDPTIDIAWDLWKGSFDEHQDATLAWKVTLSALLQDPRMMFF
jgi:hypothetical protein